MSLFIITIFFWIFQPKREEEWYRYSQVCNIYRRSWALKNEVQTTKEFFKRCTQWPHSALGRILCYLCRYTLPYVQRSIFQCHLINFLLLFHLKLGIYLVKFFNSFLFVTASVTFTINDIVINNIATRNDLIWDTLKTINKS